MSGGIVRLSKKKKNSKYEGQRQLTIDAIYLQ